MQLAIGHSIGIVGKLLAAAFICCKHSDALAEAGEPFPESMPFFTQLAANDPILLTNGFHREYLGELNLPSGQIVAVDPLTLFGAEHKLTQEVPPGHYKVEVYWVDDKDWGKRNAFATLRFSQEPVNFWKMALVFKQDANTLKPTEYYGYSVDAGMGSFMSPEAVKALADSMSKAERELKNYSNYYDDVLAAPLESVNPSRMLFAPPTDPEKNIAMFASGFGDGSYPSYFGFNANHQPVILITTFLVADESKAPPLSEQPLPHKAQ